MKAEEKPKRLFFFFANASMTEYYNPTPSCSNYIFPAVASPWEVARLLVATFGLAKSSSKRETFSLTLVKRSPLKRLLSLCHALLSGSCMTNLFLSPQKLVWGARHSSWLSLLWPWGVLDRWESDGVAHSHRCLLMMNDLQRKSDEKGDCRSCPRQGMSSGGRMLACHARSPGLNPQPLIIHPSEPQKLGN